MLRTTITDTPFGQRWVLLKERWESTRNTRTGRKCPIDLEDVISVDTFGRGGTARNGYGRGSPPRHKGVHETHIGIVGLETVEPGIVKPRLVKS
jgi:hypothetical protein